MSKLIWVDDDVNNPELRPDREALEEKGHVLQCFSNITDFMNYFENKKHTEAYDGIIIDMMMPPGKVFDMKESEYGGRTGFLLSKKVKVIPSLQNAKIIIYSIVNSQDLINEYCGTDIHFLGKTELLSDEFVTEVEKILNSK